MSEIKIPEHFKLMEGEVPYWYGRFSWKYIWVSLSFGILILLISLSILKISSTLFLLVFLLVFFFIIIHFISIILRVLGSEYLITNKRIYIKQGIIRRKIQEVRIEWVRAVALSQGIFERIINCGNVGISTASEYVGTIVLKGVSNPIEVKGIIEELLSKNETL